MPCRAKGDICMEIDREIDENAIHDLSLVELVAGIETGKIDSWQVMSSTLARSADIEPVLNAWQYIPDAESVQSEWERQRKTFANGLFRGVPIGIKDTFDVSGMPSERGSQIFRGRIPTDDASSVAILRRNGMFPLGKTVTTELAYFAPGATSNPHNLAHTPGGSSSGSAALVSARVIPVAFGSQTAASVIRPASYCGVVGYVATRGVVSLRGVLPLAGSFDSFGVLSRTVEDVAMVFGALTNELSSPGCEQIKPRRILAVEGQGFATLDTDMKNAFGHLLDQLDNEGVEVSLAPDEFGANWSAQHEELMACEAASNFSFEYEHSKHELSESFLALVERGLNVTHGRRAQLDTDLWGARIGYRNLIAGYDAIVAPAAPGAAPEGLHSTGNPCMSRPWQYLGSCQIALPLALCSNRLPLGVQLIGGYYGDRRLMCVANWFQHQLQLTSPSPAIAH